MTPRTAPKASRKTLPWGTTSGRTSPEPTASISATATDRIAARAKTLPLAMCSWSIMTDPIAGPSAEAERAAGSEDAHRQTQPVARA